MNNSGNFNSRRMQGAVSCSLGSLSCSESQLLGFNKLMRDSSNSQNSSLITPVGQISGISPYNLSNISRQSKASNAEKNSNSREEGSSDESSSNDFNFQPLDDILEAESREERKSHSNSIRSRVNSSQQNGSQSVIQRLESLNE